MLVKTPPPIHFPVTTSSSKWKNQLGHNNSICSNGGGSSNTKRRVVMVRAGYRRKPMDTAGAYELRDDKTGEKYIVWGGIEEEDQQQVTLPPNHIISSNWDATPSSNVSAVTNGASVKPPVRRVSADFGRLKAQSVRALAGKTSRVKRDIVQNDYDDGEQVERDDKFLDRPVSSLSVLDSVRKKLVKDALPRSKPLRERRSPSTKTVQRKNSYGGTEKHGIEGMETSPIGRDRNQELNSKQESSRISYSKGSAPNSRGWGNRSSRAEMEYDYEYESQVHSKKWHKLSAGNGFFSRKSFREVGCSDYMMKSLEQLQYLRPSHIQAMAFGPAVEGKSCVIADQSGSGKTLAYLVPVIQRLRQEELEGLSKSSSGCPRVVIMVPTAELASQVLKNCRSLSKFGVPFSSMAVTGGFRQKTQLENLQQGVDVLIATPGRLMYLVKEGALELTDLRCAVFDEVDILYNDEDFEVALQGLISSAPVTAQYLFVTATLPVDVYNKLVEVFPDCEVVMGPGVHRVSTGLEEFLVDCSGEDGTERTPETAFLNKKNALLQLVEESSVSRTIIFCNKIETCRKVENALKRFDRKGSQLQVFPFHTAVAQESRVANLKEFTESKPAGDSLFLVCTDRASRGIDFADVDHVVLFDFPRDPSEYVRRVGRTARGAGGKGKAFIFVVGKQVPLARKILERNQKGHPLHDVPSAYELMG